MTNASVATSSAEVGSSRIRIGASRSRARAIVTRCFSPSDSDIPASPITVSIALRQRSDQIIDPRQPCGALDRRIVGSGPAIGDVVANRQRKDQRRLQDQRDLAAQRLQAIFAHIDAVDLDHARGRVVKAATADRARRRSHPSPASGSPSAQRRRSPQRARRAPRSPLSTAFDDESEAARLPRSAPAG